MSDYLRIQVTDDTPLRDLVFATLRKAILMGNLRPGDRLLEEHLAARMGVSRTPIREAIRKLELEGLVIMVPRCGASVASINADKVKDVLEVRSALDELAIKLACQNITEEQIRRLNEAKLRFETNTTGSSIARIVDADVKFHDIIIEASGNEKLVQMMTNLSESIYRYRYECVKDSLIYDELIEEHREMYDSIIAGDKERAANAARIHIEKQQQVIVSNL